jgi:hypothetical protein
VTLQLESEFLAEAKRLTIKGRRLLAEAKQLRIDAQRLAVERSQSNSLAKVKMTHNRKVILKCLTEPNSDCGGQPPYCASDIHYMLEHNFEWYGAKKPVSIAQIHRTLRDLLAAGLIIKETQLDEPLDNGLPSLVNYYQLAGEFERNKLLFEISEALRTAGNVHGTFLFSTDHFFNQPFNADQKSVVMADIKSLMQRTHPDKASGFEYEFNQLNAALKYCRAKIDLLKTPNKRLKLD